MFCVNFQDAVRGVLESDFDWAAPRRRWDIDDRRFADLRCFVWIAGIVRPHFAAFHDGNLDAALILTHGPEHLFDLARYGSKLRDHQEIAELRFIAKRIRSKIV